MAKGRPSASAKVTTPNTRSGRAPGSEAVAPARYSRTPRDAARGHQRGQPGAAHGPREPGHVAAEDGHEDRRRDERDAAEQRVVLEARKPRGADRSNHVVPVHYGLIGAFADALKPPLDAADRHW